MHKGIEMRDGKMGDRMEGGRMENMNTELGLTDDQLVKMKTGSESFKTRAKFFHDNQSLSEDQKKIQFEALHQERMNSFKSFLTAEQIVKMEQIKMNHNDGKEKIKGDGWKEKIKTKIS